MHGTFSKDREWGIIMAVQLNSSYLRRSYQLLAKLSPAEMSIDEAFERSSNIIYEWAKRKFVKIFRQMPYKKATLDDKRDGNEIGVFFDPDNGRFIFRGVHPDAYVPGRMWTTDVQLQREGNDCLLAVRLSVTSLQSCTEDVPFSQPDFVRLLIENIGISDVIKISGQKHLLETQDDVNGFVSFLENPDRHMPVVLLTPCSYIEEARCNGYMMDAAQMATDLTGVAHVFQISSEINEYLTESVGKQWSAFNGAVRTYYPGISFEESDYYQHPLITQQSICLRDTIQSDDPNLCMHEIEEYVQKYVLTQRFLWEGQGIDFYLTAYQNHLREQRTASKQSRDELISSYEEQLEQLQKQRDENLSLADSYAKDCESCRKENDQQRQLIGRLKAQVSALRFQLQKCPSESFEESIPEDGSYSDIEEWIGRYYPDKLFLHARAARSLKEATYADSRLVYKCLKLLATSYYDYCTGLITYDCFTAACKQVDPGLDERGAITDVAAGMQGDAYYIQYKGKKRKLERHLTKGSNKDRRYCLRIYFFWDDQDQIIVIGDLPHHLDTGAT